MMMSRRTFRIGEIGRVVTGKTPSTADSENFGSDFPFLTPTDMHGVKWARKTERGLSSLGAGKLRCQVSSGAVAVSCIGWQMGKAILIDRPTYTNQQINTIIPNDDFSAEYLYYYLATRREELLSIGSAGGVRTPIISKSAFEAIEISLPDLLAQRRIASILSAYDDLIENNTRRIAILEEMARKIYEEWFVHFRFPGHEQVKMVESELGLIPEGIEKTRLGDLIEFKKGKKPLTISDSPAEGLLPHLLIDALRGGDKREYVPIEKAISARDNDTIMVMDGSGSCDVFVGHTGVIGSTLGRYRTIDPRICPYWLYLFFHVNQAEIKAKNIGAAIPHANKDFINSMEVFLPPSEKIQAFDEIIQPIFGLIKKLRLKNSNLRTTRDLLLPKLISGELDVSNLPEFATLTAPEEAIAE